MIGLKAMETAVSAGPVEDLPLRLESWPRRLGHLPTGLPQDLGNRSADSAIPTATWKTPCPCGLAPSRTGRLPQFPQPRRRREDWTRSKKQKKIRSTNRVSTRPGEVHFPPNRATRPLGFTYPMFTAWALPGGQPMRSA